MSDQNTASGWRQVNLWCDDWEAAEHMAVTHLRPLLAEAEDNKANICWWFVRKDPSWRLRLRTSDGHGETAAALVDRVATALMDQGAIRRWTGVVYEPEVHAFGGVEAMAVAHDLFSADSRHLLTHLAQAQTDHRRELGVLLGTRLLHAAGQDWYEQGDIWEQVAAHRTGEHRLGEPSPTTVAAVRRLLTAAADTDDSPLRSVPAWPMAFQHAGRGLADLAQRGTLTRGLRAVLAHHLLFTFNRLGVPAEHQALLAATAGQVIFQNEHASGHEAREQLQP